MSIFRRAWTAAYLLMVTSLVGLALPSTAASREPSAWRDAFQSSPASYDPLTPKFEKLLVDKFGMPPAMLEKMRPQMASGTQRIRIAVSSQGQQIRVRISNEEGDAPLILTAASVGLAGNGFEAKPGSLRALTFGGRRSVTVPTGAPILSDPIALPVVAGTELLISTYANGQSKLDPLGGDAIAIAAGDQTLTGGMAGMTPMLGRPIVTGVETLSPARQHVIATLGDSITDGNRMSVGELRSWPEELARRLAARSTGGRYSVVNAGIGGNRLLGSGWGPSALARLDRDVLRIDGLSYLIVLEGTNDIGMAGSTVFGNNPTVSPDDITNAYRQIIARAHARGVKVLLGTIMPFEGSATHYSPANEQIRTAVNTWIRMSHEADGVIDFDLLARDPKNPKKMKVEFGSEDGLHPGTAGYKAMGDTIELALFR